MYPSYVLLIMRGCIAAGLRSLNRIPHLPKCGFELLAWYRRNSKSESSGRESVSASWGVFNTPPVNRRGA